ncbi:MULTISPECIES: phage tail tape measure protein [unclassified Microbacterium]|uniref:phage tail tape measure protein n=1 Tax=unclassified Microbacterium TaxID=2609290 RepID=UPI003C2F2199
MRVAELETLFTANVDQIEKAERQVQQTGQRIESKPIKAKIDADAKGALGAMDRVEGQAKRLVSKDQVVRLDADVCRGEASVKRINDQLEALRIKALGGLDVTAETKRAEAQLQKVTRNLTALKTARNMIEVQADPADALAGVAQVEDAAKRLVTMKTALQVNANISSAEARVEQLKSQIEYFRAMSPTVQVDADIARAENRLKGAEAALRDLNGARAMMVVDVNEGGAEQKLKNVADVAEESGNDGGRRSGAALVGGIVGALASIPIAGAVIGVGKAAAQALLDSFQAGLAQEKGRDDLQALTGISEAAAARLARAAGEAYANVFGDSIESNMDTTRLALQFDLIDEDNTTSAAQKTIEGLAGIADVLREDVQPTATAVTTLLKTGMAKSAQEAFDLLATGQREGANRAEDLLDTFTEYPVVLARLGLTGQEMLGLINQGLEAGARNSDVAADALKEFQIRATDGSKASSDGFKQLGLDAEDMTARIARGGKDARAGLQEVLDRLRDTEDPVIRNAAAVALFGTKAEDLGEALFAMDLTSAVDQLNGVEGAARRMFDTMADNDATKLEGAQRNIEVAVSSMQGALAVAFSEPLGDFADWVSSNRGPLLQFFVDLANGALDFAETATDGIGAFVSGPLAEMVAGVAGIIDVFNGNEGRPKELDDLAEGMRQFTDYTDGAIGKIDEARTKLNEFAEPAVAMANLNDAQRRLAESIGQVGDETGRVEDQVRAALQALKDEGEAAAATGENVTDLNARYKAGTDALLDQMVATGMTRDEAKRLIDTVKSGARGKLTFDVNTAAASNAINRLISANNGRRITLNVVTKESRVVFFGSSHVATSKAVGGPITGPGSGTSDDVPIWASNGEHMLTADEVMKAGGHGAIYRLREAIRSGALRERLRYATGGEISLSHARLMVRRAEEKVRASRGKKKDVRERAAEELERAQEQLESTRASIRGEHLDFNTAQRRGENREAGMNGRGLSLIDELTELSYSLGGKQGPRMRTQAASMEKQYLSLEKAAERASESVEKSGSRLSDLKDRIASMASAVSNSLRRTFDVSQWTASTRQVTSTRMVDGVAITSAQTKDVPLTAKSIRADAKAKAQAIERFQKKLSQMRGKGYAAALVEEIAMLGSEAGEPVADALLGGSKDDVKSINDSYQKAGKFSDLAGTQSAEAQTENGKTMRELVDAAEKQLALDERNQDRIEAKLSTLTDKVIRALASGYGSAQKRANGGPIFGPGTRTSDSIPMWASTDEHMWSAAEVDGAGGHQAVARMRKAAVSGQLDGMITKVVPVAASPAVNRQLTVAPQFVNPIVKNLEQDAWETAQILAAAAGGEGV